MELMTVCVRVRFDIFLLLRKYGTDDKRTPKERGGDLGETCGRGWNRESPVFDNSGRPELLLICYLFDHDYTKSCSMYTRNV